ncbi:hypothetical protein [Klebsiella variicola]|uniref:hypothetical protein n=1 Tax=Klebsiella variicola TaxID=244366 RepID=UPI002231325D|nr:hypothetical protein [Klebsiella variicola]
MSEAQITVVCRQCMERCAAGSTWPPDLAEFVALVKAQRYITELDREHQTFRIVGVRSVKASLRVENSKSRFIELWLRPGIFLPHKRPEHSMSYYAGMAVLTGTKAEIY